MGACCCAQGEAVEDGPYTGGRWRPENTESWKYRQRRNERMGRFKVGRLGEKRKNKQKIAYATVDEEVDLDSLAESLGKMSSKQKSQWQEGIDEFKRMPLRELEDEYATTKWDADVAKEMFEYPIIPIPPFRLLFTQDEKAAVDAIHSAGGKWTKGGYNQYGERYDYLYRDPPEYTPGDDGVIFVINIDDLAAKNVASIMSNMHLYGRVYIVITGVTTESQASDRMRIAMPSREYFLRADTPFHQHAIRRVWFCLLRYADALINAGDFGALRAPWGESQRDKALEDYKAVRAAAAIGVHASTNMGAIARARLAAVALKQPNLEYEYVRDLDDRCLRARVDRGTVRVSRVPRDPTLYQLVRRMLADQEKLDDEAEAVAAAARAPADAEDEDED